MTAEHATHIYKCTRGKRERGGTGHKSVNMDLAEQITEDAVLGAIMEGRLDGPEDLGELTEVQDKINEVGRKLDAAQDVLMDPDISDKARAKKRVLELEAERALLQDQRADLVAQRAQGSASEEFRAYLADRPENDHMADSAAVDRLSGAWVALSMQQKRDIIRGSFTVQVAGPDVVVVEPSRALNPKEQ